MPFHGVIAGHGGILKLIFSEKDHRLLGVHCLRGIASDLVGIGKIVIHFNGTINAFLQVTLNTPTYTYAYKYATIDAIRKLDNFKNKSIEDFIKTSLFSEKRNS
jgi:NAD(P) transhydrogenase